MMKKRRGDSDVFGLSFLDIISCGFGAVVLLVLISDFAVNEEAMETKYDELSAQISKLANLKSDLMSISAEQKRKSSGVADTSEVNEMLAARLSSKETILENQLSELASMQVMLDSLVDDIATKKEQVFEALLQKEE